MSQYNQVKREIVAKRSTGRPAGAGDQRSFTASIEKLEKDLAVMSRNPMEFDL